MKPPVVEGIDGRFVVRDDLLDAKLPPPFTSCSNYAAKVWRLFREAAPGALMWNVAR